MAKTLENIQLYSENRYIRFMIDGKKVFDDILKRWIGLINYFSLFFFLLVVQLIYPVLIIRSVVIRRSNVGLTLQIYFILLFKVQECTKDEHGSGKC